MPNTAIQYSLEARESLSGTIKTISGNMRGLASASDVTFKQLTSGLNASTRAAAEMRRELAQTERQAKMTGGGMDGLWKSVAGGALAAKAVTVFAEGMISATKAVVSNTSALEQSKIAFTQLLGSAGQADKFIGDLQAFAAKTPFKFSELREYAQQLVGTGTAAKNVIPVMTDLGNAVAAVGGGNEKLQRVVLAYEQVQSKGKLAGDEARQFAEAGIPVWQLLSKQLGISTAQVQKLSEEGKITAQVFDEAFHAEAVARWGGQMEAASHSLQGITSNIGDLGEQLSAKLGGPIVRVFEQELAHLVEDLSDPKTAATLDEWGENLGKAALFAAKLWDEFAKGAREAFAAIRPVTDAVGALLGSLPASGADPLAPVAKSAAALTTQTKAAVVATVDYRGQIDAAQDVLEGMRRQDQDRNYALDQQVEGERRKLTLLERQFAIQDRATSIDRLKAKIARDEQLAKNLYSQPGQAAGARLEDERAQLADMLRDQSRDKQKYAIQDRITGLEETKKGLDHQAQLRERAQQDYIDSLRKAESEAKTGADVAAAAQDEWAKRVAATTEEYRSMYDHTSQSAPVMQGQLGALNEQVKLALDFGGQLAKTWREDVAPAFKTAGDMLGDLWTAGDKVAQLFGFKGGLGEAFLKETQTTFGAVGLIIKQTASELRRLAIGAALLKDLSMGGNNFENTQQAWKDFAAQDPLSQAGVGLIAGMNGGKLPGTVTQPGGGSGGAIGDLPKRAGGGPVGAGQTYVVGERGPELLHMGQSGYVSPNGSDGLRSITIRTVCEECGREQFAENVVRNGELIANTVGRHTRGANHF